MISKDKTKIQRLMRPKFTWEGRGTLFLQEDEETYQQQCQVTTSHYEILLGIFFKCDALYTYITDWKYYFL